MWQALYKAAKKRFDAEPEFKARAREAVTQLQAGNELFLQARLSPYSMRACRAWPHGALMTCVSMYLSSCGTLEFQSLLLPVTVTVRC